MWDLIVSVPDHCLSFYFDSSLAIPTRDHTAKTTAEALCNNFIIEIKLDFLCIKICWEVLKPEPESRGLQHLPRGPADVNVSEKHV